MLGITDYLWRLIPANPILLRVVEAGGKRRRDLFIRMGYLGLLVGLVLFSLASSSTSSAGSDLGDLAKASARIFRNLSYIQLGLVALLAPIFTAGAITQEKDSQTYDILLATPLTNGQVVLGSLLSRLFFVIALLISGIPIFSITQIFGGVAISSIVMSFLIAAATAFVTGAMAMAIATFKVGTRRTIFSFYFFIIVYLITFVLLDKVPFFRVLPDPPAIAGQQIRYTSWFTGLHPFLALRVIFNEPGYQPPHLGSLPPHLQVWPIGWYLTSPASFYVTFMFFLSLILVAPSIVLLRRIAQSSSSIRGWIMQKLHLSTGDRTRKPRGVWNNPIAWREAKTKASAARASILRYGFILLGMIAPIVIVVLHASEQPMSKYLNPDSYNPDTRLLWVFEGDSPKQYKVTPITKIKLNGTDVSPDMLKGRYEVKGITIQGTNLTSLDVNDPPRKISVEQARDFLLGAVIVEFAVILLIVTNTAASTVTREKEDGTLDLLLSTPITSRYYIWGKLRGLVSFVLPLIAVPVASVLIFVMYDLFRFIATLGGASEWTVFPEAAIILPGTLIIVVAFAAILGMNMSLRFRTTVQAVMSSVGIVAAICAAMGWCGFQLLSSSASGNGVGLIIGSFSPFTIMTALINPYKYGGTSFQSGSEDVGSARVIMFLFGWIATAGYAFVVWTMYKSMVKNFDMTIRRQSR